MTATELIRFGESVDKNLGPGRAFPFVYSLIGPSEYVDGVRVSGDNWGPARVVSQYASLQALGVTVPTGRTVMYPRKLDSDYHFRLEAVRYTVFQTFDPDSIGPYWWNVAYLTGNVPRDVWNDQYGVNLRLDMSVSLSLPSQQGRYVYGGDSTNQIQNPGDLLPVDVDVLEGNLYGMGQLRTPVLMARNSTVVFRFTNKGITNQELYIMGAMIGVKVRV